MDHFYDPVNEENYLGIFGTALDRLVTDYENAVKEYKNYIRSNRKCLIKTSLYSIYWTLGRAVHFVQDMANPYHSSNMVKDLYYTGLDLKWSNHIEYESWAQNTLSNNRTQFTENSMNFNPNKSVEEVGIDAAKFSHIEDQFWESYEEPRLVGRNIKYVKVYYLPRVKVNLESYIKRAERDTAQVIYSFYLETH